MDLSKYKNKPLSFGGGVNSVALAILLIENGWREPIVFSDTESEWPETYEYIEYFREEYLRKYKLDIVVLGEEWRIPSAKMPLDEYCRKKRITPSIQWRWCTNKFKLDPTRKWCKANGYNFDEMLVGISLDEARRQKTKIRPLVDLQFDREKCMEIITEAGLEIPPKSSCWLCPFQSVEKFKELLIKHPDLFEKAIELEKLATERRADLFGV